jgi:hypothetical protein
MSEVGKVFAGLSLAALFVIAINYGARNDNSRPAASTEPSKPMIGLGDRVTVRENGSGCADLNEMDKLVRFAGRTRQRSLPSSVQRKM